MTKALESIPNSLGFTFTGVMKDGSKAACIVKVDGQGLHYITDELGNRVFSNLLAWS